MMPFSEEIPPHFKDLPSVLAYSEKVLNNMSEHSLNEIIGATITFKIAMQIKREIERDAYSFEMTCVAP